MVDSYILHIISDINYARSVSDLNRVISAQLEESKIMSQRSLYYASNPYAKKQISYKVNLYVIKNGDRKA